MLRSKKGESISGVIVGVVILMFIMIAMINVFDFNTEINKSYSNSIAVKLHELNSQSISDKLDLDNIDNGETYYVHRDDSTNTYEVYTGAINEQYKYVDSMGNRIDNTEENYGKVFERIFVNNKDVLKNYINPGDISDIAFHYDATNIDSTNNSSYVDGDDVGIFRDLSGNLLNASQTNLVEKPLYSSGSIDGREYLYFNGANKMTIPDSTFINDNSFDSKSFALVFKTSNDVRTEQVIYEQGGGNRGYAFNINNGYLYIGMYNNVEWPGGNQYKKLSLLIEPFTLYYVMMVQDTVSDNLSIYLNGSKYGELTGILNQPSHDLAGLGDVNGQTVLLSSNSSSPGPHKFNGYIGELTSWNKVLTEKEIFGLNNYYIDKWFYGIKSLNKNTSNYNIQIIE